MIEQHIVAWVEIDDRSGLAAAKIQMAARRELPIISEHAVRKARSSGRIAVGISVDNRAGESAPLEPEARLSRPGRPTCGSDEITIGEMRLSGVTTVRDNARSNVVHKPASGKSHIAKWVVFGLEVDTRAGSTA